MKSQRLWAIPDIHGRLDLLTALIQDLVTKHGLELSRDKLIFLGDMIDRGFESAGVIRRVRSLQSAFPENVVVLAGNHEWLMIDGLAKGDEARDLWMINGGAATVNSFGNRADMEDAAKWMAALPLSHEEPGFFFSHAPVPKGAEPGAYTKDQLIWSYPGGYDRERGYAMQFEDGTVGVCGHIHALHARLKEPRFYDHYIYADAGCGCHRDAPLVAIEVRSRQTVYAWPADAVQTMSLPEETA